jgi:hypothetical protein
MRLTAAALAAVVLGAIIGYGLGSPGPVGVLWTVGLAVMLAGTAVLVAVLIRSMAGLRRATERRRTEPTAASIAAPTAKPSASGPAPAPAPRASERTRASERIRTPDLVQISPAAAMRNGAAVRRYRDGAADE